MIQKSSLLVLTSSLLFLSSATGRAESDNAFTGYEKFVESAFSVQALSLKNHQPSPYDQKMIEAVKGVVLETIDGGGALWFSKITHPAIATQAHWALARDAIRKAPVWICNEKCSCPDFSPYGCALDKRLGETAASAVFLDKCFFSPAGCATPSGGAAHSTNLVRVMADSLAMVAWFTYTGSVERFKSKAAVERAWPVIASTINVMERLSAACPGPFPESGESFLRKSGHLRDLNAFLDVCAAKLLEPLRAKGLPGICRAVIDPEKWGKLLGGGPLTSDPSAVRCDEFCETLTCGPRQSSVPRILHFGPRWFMSVPEGACEGSVPNEPSAFLERVVRSVAMTSELRKPSASEAITACVRALLPEKAKSARPTVLPAVPVEGPGVDLIEN